MLCLLIRSKRSFYNSIVCMDGPVGLGGVSDEDETLDTICMRRANNRLVSQTCFKLSHNVRGVGEVVAVDLCVS